MKKICLVLSGGGARGFTHLGVLTALTELKVPVGKVICSSMGAVIGAKYAQQGSIDGIYNFIEDFSQNINEYIRKSKGISIRKKKLKRFFHKVYGDFLQSECVIPLEIIASSSIDGTPIILDDDLILENVMASISMPFVNNPVKKRLGNFYDPGLVSNFPIEFYRKKDGVLFGVNSGSNKFTPQADNDGLMAKLFKVQDIYFLLHSNRHLHKLYEKEKIKRLSSSGYILDLSKKLDLYSNLGFEKYDELIEIGYKSVINRKNKIIEKLS